MLEQFQEALAKTGLIPTGARVLVGYSGGPDSTCLLHLLHRSKVDVVAAHLHHGQREEAALEFNLCAAFCDEQGIPFVGGNADVPQLAKNEKIGLEEAGRKARYAFFEMAQRQTECDLVATAHTLSDQLETVLLNLARGTGLTGIAGIPRKRGDIIRPLLDFSKEDTRRYCEHHELWTHDDPANSDLSFSRARIRHRVLPELFAINPRADQAINNLAQIAQEESAFLDGAAAAALEQSEVELNGQLRFLSIEAEAAFDRHKLLSLPAVLFKRSLRLAASAIGGPLDYAQTLLLADAVANTTSGSVTAEGGIVVIEWTEDRVHVRELAQIETYRYPLTTPGETESETFRWKFIACPTENPALNKRDALCVYIDQSKTVGASYFRSAQAGDTIQPLGFEGTRKVSDLLSEARLTKAARSRLPVVCDLVGPYWIPGVCVSQRVAWESNKKEQAWQLEFGPL